MNQTISSKDSMKEYTKAYTAGLMDAEGCIGIYEAHKTSGNIVYELRVVIANINLPIIKWLVETFGGNYTKNTPEKGRVWYQWRMGISKGALKFLSNILPYLQIKKEEAEAVLYFYKVKNNSSKEILSKLVENIRLLKNRECSTTEMLDGSIDNKKTHAYLAGIFDGEGCVSVGIASTGKPVLHINVANNFTPLINLYLRIYGGWVQTNKAHGNTKESYRWWITRKELQEKFLLQILPYLKIKKEQAKLALNYVRLPKENIRVEKTKLAVKIKELNQLKIQPDLISDYESDPTEMLVVA